MPNNVLITGGTGFIGSRLTQACLQAEDTVNVLAQENTDAEKINLSAIRASGANVINASLTDVEDLDVLIKGVDVVYHLAAAQHEANVPDQHFVDVNVEGTRKLLEAAERAGVTRFVHGSTIGVYGVLDGMIDENSPCNPDNIYGRTKFDAEKLVLDARDKISVCAIRISETYGPGDRRLLKLFKSIKKGMFFVIGKGANLHHLIYVDDLVEGLRVAAMSPAADGELFVLAGPQPLSTRVMVDNIAASLEQKVSRWHAPMWIFMSAAVVLETTLKPFGIQPPLHRRRMDFFKKSFTISRDKTTNILGFEPRTTFKDGVAQTARWYTEQDLL